MNEEKPFLRNNPQLKAPNTKQFITPTIFKERMEQFKRIHDDIVYFAQKYFYIISLDAGKCLIKLYPKQAELVKAMTQQRRVITLSCRQAGKCVDGSTLITIRNKHTKQIQQITIKQFFDRFHDQLKDTEIDFKIGELDE